MKAGGLPAAGSLAQRVVGKTHDGLIVRGLLWGAAFVIGGKLAGAAKEIVVAWRYGTSSQVDAYLFVFNLVTWPVAVWFAALAGVLVPLVARVRRGDTAAFVRFRSELLALTIGLGLLLGALCWLGLTWVAGSTWVALPRETAAAVVSLTAPMATLATLGTVTCLLSAWMQAGQRHANTLFEGIPAVAIAIAVLLVPIGGIDALVYGTLVGFALHLLSLMLALQRTGDIEPPALPLRSPYWPAFRSGFGAMVAGQALLALAAVLDQFFAAQLNVGAVSTLAYANRVLALLLGIGVTVVARATLPVFSAASHDEVASLWTTARRWTFIVFIAGMATTFSGWWMARPGVELLFQRGAFTPGDGEAVAHVLQHGLLQLPFYFAAVVLQSFMSARGRYRAIALVSGACILAKAAASAWLVPRHGLAGLQWATAIMFAVFSIGLLVVNAVRTSDR